jgi:putative transposase
MSYVKNLGTSVRIEKLTDRRNRKVENYIHQASKYIKNYCTKNSIDTVIVGLNPQIKQKICLGKINNQKFVCIPYFSFIKKLLYKCEEIGVKVIANEESYTSKASFLDRDVIPKYGQDCEQNNFSGRRVYRGLYRSKNGCLINADVNAAANIICKVFPNAFADGIEGVGFRPLRINILTKKS